MGDGLTDYQSDNELLQKQLTCPSYGYIQIINQVQWDFFVSQCNSLHFKTLFMFIALVTSGVSYMIFWHYLAKLTEPGHLDVCITWIFSVGPFNFDPIRLVYINMIKEWYLGQSSCSICYKLNWNVLTSYSFIQTGKSKSSGGRMSLFRKAPDRSMQFTQVNSLMHMFSQWDEVRLSACTMSLEITEKTLSPIQSVTVFLPSENCL